MVAQIHCKLFASFICTICPSKFLPPFLKLFLSFYLSPSLSIIGWGKIHLLEVFSFAPGLNGVLYGSLDLTVYIIVAHLEPEICITSSPPLCLCSPAKGCPMKLIPEAIVKSVHFLCAVLDRFTAMTTQCTHSWQARALSLTSWHPSHSSSCPFFSAS